MRPNKPSFRIRTRERFIAGAEQGEPGAYAQKRPEFSSGFWGNIFKDKILEDFPDSPVVKTQASNTRGTGPVSGQGMKIPHAAWCDQENFQK